MSINILTIALANAYLSSPNTARDQAIRDYKDRQRMRKEAHSDFVKIWCDIFYNSDSTTQEKQHAKKVLKSNSVTKREMKKHKPIEPDQDEESCEWGWPGQ